MRDPDSSHRTLLQSLMVIHTFVNRQSTFGQDHGFARGFAARSAFQARRYLNLPGILRCGARLIKGISNQMDLCRWPEAFPFRMFPTMNIILDG